MSWLQPGEVAKRKDVSRIAVFKAIKRGDLRATKAIVLGQFMWLIRPEWADAWTIHRKNQRAGRIARAARAKDSR